MGDLIFNKILPIGLIIGVFYGALYGAWRVITMDARCHEWNFIREVYSLKNKKGYAVLKCKYCKKYKMVKNFKQYED